MLNLLLNLCVFLDPYCAVATATEMACYELNILELWGDQGTKESNTTFKKKCFTVSPWRARLMRHFFRNFFKVAMWGGRFHCALLLG